MGAIADALKQRAQNVVNAAKQTKVSPVANVAKAVEPTVAPKNELPLRTQNSKYKTSIYNTLPKSEPVVNTEIKSNDDPWQFKPYSGSGNAGESSWTPLTDAEKQRSAEKLEQDVRDITRVGSPSSPASNLASSPDMAEWYKNHGIDPDGRNKEQEGVRQEELDNWEEWGNGNIIGSQISVQDMADRSDRVRIKDADAANVNDMGFVNRGHEDDFLSKLHGHAINAAEGINGSYLLLSNARRDAATKYGEDAQHFVMNDGREFTIPHYTQIYEQVIDQENKHPDWQGVRQVLSAAELDDDEYVVPYLQTVTWPDGTTSVMSRSELGAMLEEVPGSNGTLFQIPGTQILYDTTREQDGDPWFGEVTLTPIQATWEEVAAHGNDADYYAFPNWIADIQAQLPEGVSYDDFVETFTDAVEKQDEENSGFLNLLKTNPELFDYDEGGWGPGNILPNEIHLEDIVPTMVDALGSTAPYLSLGTGGLLTLARTLIAAQGVDPDSYDTEHDDYRNPGEVTASDYVSKMVAEPLNFFSEHMLGAGSNVVGKPIINAIKKTSLPRPAKAGSILFIDSAGEGVEENLQSPIEEMRAKGVNNIFADVEDTDEYGNPIYADTPIPDRWNNFNQGLLNDFTIGSLLGAGIGLPRDISHDRQLKAYGVDQYAAPTTRPSSVVPVDPENLLIPDIYKKNLDSYTRRDNGED